MDLFTTIVRPLLKILALMLPYALIPLTFKFAGGIFNTFTGMVNDRSKGIFDRAKQGRAHKLERTKQGNMFKGAPEGSLRGRANRFSEGTMNVRQAGFDPRKMRSRMRTAVSSNSYDHAMEGLEKNQAMRAIAANDDLLSAGMHGRGTEADVRSYLQSKGQTGAVLSQNVASVMAAKRSMGEQGFQIAAAIANAGTGTGYGGGAGEMMEAINHVAGGDRALAGRMLADARGRATQARRPDLAGAGFGDSLNAMEALYNGVDKSGNTATMASVTKDLDRKALKSQGGNYIVGARKSAVERLAPTMMEDLNAAVAANDDVAISRELAALAGRYDAMGQVAPENAEVMAEKVLGQSLLSATGNPSLTNRDGTTMTVRQMIEARRSDERFLEMRREYATAGAAAGARAAAEAAQEPQG